MTVKGIPSCCELSDDDFSIFTMNIQSPLFFALEGTGMRWDEWVSVYETTNSSLVCGFMQTI